MPNLENFSQRLFQIFCHLLNNNQPDLLLPFCRFVTGFDKNLPGIFVFSVTFSPEMADSRLAQSLKYTQREILKNNHLKHYNNGKNNRH